MIELKKSQQKVVFLSSIVIEGARTLFSFFKCVLKKTKIKNKATETLEQGVKYGVFIVNFEHISHLVLVFLLLTLIM